MPLPIYTRPDGARNLASYLPDNAEQPDLGPRCECAYGAYQGSGTVNAHGRQLGTSNMHVEMADVVSVLAHVEGIGSGLFDDESTHYFGETIEPTHGAIWHIFSQADTRALEGVLPRLVRDLGNREGSEEMLNSCKPLLDSVVYLDETLLRHVQQLAGVTPHVVLQKVGDAVLVPAGCAHQVRHLHDHRIATCSRS